jgi:hypothetical protein
MGRPPASSADVTMASGGARASSVARPSMSMAHMRKAARLGATSLRGTTQGRVTRWSARSVKSKERKSPRRSGSPSGIASSFARTALRTASRLVSMFVFCLRERSALCS